MKGGSKRRLNAAAAASRLPGQRRRQSTENETERENESWRRERRKTEWWCESALVRIGASRTNHQPQTIPLLLGPLRRTLLIPHFLLSVSGVRIVTNVALDRREFCSRKKLYFRLMLKSCPFFHFLTSSSAKFQNARKKSNCAEKIVWKLFPGEICARKKPLSRTKKEKRKKESERKLWFLSPRSVVGMMQ